MKIGNVEVYGIIYKITNKINGKCYIGQTVNGFKKRYDYKGEGIERVYNYHMSFKKYGEKYNDYIIKSVDKYGFDAFEVIEIYDVAFSKVELDLKEKHYISIYKCTDRRYGYNNTEGGSNGRPTEEVKEKYRQAKLGKNKGKENNKSRKVICVTTNKIFDCISDASIFYNCSRHGICDCCKGINKRAGKLKDGTPLVWRYYEDYLNMSEKELQQSIEDAKSSKKGSNAYQSKSVICITTGKVFTSAKEGSLYYGIANTTIIRCCKGKAKSAGKLPDGTKLVWEYCIEN